MNQDDAPDHLVQRPFVERRSIAARRDDTSWHLDKSTTMWIIGGVATAIAALLAEAASTIWFVSQLDAHQHSLEVTVADIVKRQAERDTQQDLQGEASDALIRRQLDRIENNQDRIIDGLRVQRERR